MTFMKECIQCQSGVESCLVCLYMSDGFFQLEESNLVKLYKITFLSVSDVGLMAMIRWCYVCSSIQVPACPLKSICAFCNAIDEGVSSDVSNAVRLI